MSIVILEFFRYTYTGEQTYMYQAKTLIYFLLWLKRSLGSNGHYVLRRN